MATEVIPYLCGGIFFNLLIEASKEKTSARSKINGVKDHINDLNLMQDLVSLVVGDKFMPDESTFKKNTSDYKRCIISTSTYISFGDIVVIKSFNNRVLSGDPNLY